MKKLLLISIPVLTVVIFTIFACNSFIDDQNKFPTYSKSIYGKKAEHRELSHQNCCECEISGKCHVKKCCSGGENCSCSCVETWLELNCSCSGCVTASVTIWLEEDDFIVYQDFYNILSTESTISATNARGFLLDILNAFASDNYENYLSAQNRLKTTVPNLRDETKLLINEFYDTYGYSDQRF